MWQQFVIVKEIQKENTTVRPGALQCSTDQNSLRNTFPQTEPRTDEQRIVQNYPGFTSPQAKEREVNAPILQAYERMRASICPTIWEEMTEVKEEAI